MSNMSIPRRGLSTSCDSSSKVALGSDLLRECEPSHVDGLTYFKVLKATVPLEALSEAKDGNGLFTRKGSDTRSNIDKYHSFLDAITDVTWYCKKTTLQDCIEQLNNDLAKQFLQGTAVQQNIKARAEAYAIKAMLLDIMRTSKVTKSGVKLGNSLLLLVKKFLASTKNTSSKALKAAVAVSPSFLRYKSKVQTRETDRVPAEFSTPNHAIMQLGNNCRQFCHMMVLISQ